MQTGSITVGGSKYYLNKNGVMQTGWQKIGDNYYYFKSNSAMAVNTYMDGYYLDSNGVRTEVAKYKRPVVLSVSEYNICIQ